MAIWDIDLTTEDGAVGAARLGGLACFVSAGLGLLELVLTGVTTLPSAALLATAIVAVPEIVVFLVAALRLRAGKGLVWGSFAALLLVLEIVAKLATFTGIGGLILDAILLIVIGNGVRAAGALRKGIVNPEADAEVFR